MKRLVHNVYPQAIFGRVDSRMAFQGGYHLLSTELIFHGFIPSVAVALYQLAHLVVLWCHTSHISHGKLAERYVAAFAPGHTVVFRLLQLGLYVKILEVHHVGHAFFFQILSFCFQGAGAAHPAHLLYHFLPYLQSLHLGQQRFFQTGVFTQFLGYRPKSINVVGKKQPQIVVAGGYHPVFGLRHHIGLFLQQLVVGHKKGGQNLAHTVFTGLHMNS